MYRCVKANGSDDVIAIGWDESQGGKDYHGIGTWAEFTFEAIPEPTAELLQFATSGKNILKVSGDAVILKTAEELTEEPAPGN